MPPLCVPRCNVMCCSCRWSIGLVDCCLEATAGLNGVDAVVVRWVVEQTLGPRFVAVPSGGIVRFEQPQSCLANLELEGRCSLFCSFLPLGSIVRLGLLVAVDQTKDVVRNQMLPNASPLERYQSNTTQRRCHRVGVTLLFDNIASTVVRWAVCWACCCSRFDLLPRYEKELSLHCILPLGPYRTNCGDSNSCSHWGCFVLFFCFVLFVLS